MNKVVKYIVGIVMGVLISMNCVFADIAIEPEVVSTFAFIFIGGVIFVIILMGIAVWIIFRIRKNH